MIRTFLKGFRTLIPTLILVSILSFGLRIIIPGGPADAMLAGTTDAAFIDEVNERFGLNQPIWKQYLDWVGGMLRGDLGISFATGLPVSSVLGPRLASTIEIVVLGLIIALIVGGLLGMLVAIKRETWVGRFGFALAGFGVSVPVFWIATMSVGVLGATLGLFPTNGYVPISDGLMAHIHGLVLPVILISVPVIAFMVRLVRSAMIAALESPYIRTARAMGVGSARINFDLALRNAVGPVVTYIPFLVATLVGELIIIDIVFVLPGLGSAIIDAVTFRDYATLQMIILMLAFTVITLSLVADLVLTALDPRRRREYV